MLAHPSADVDVLRTALVRGAFEYQGQKCSAASRAFVPRSLWAELRDDLADEVNALSMGDVADFGNFMGAVIDRRAFDKLAAAQQLARAELDVIAGGTADDSVGYFVRPDRGRRRRPDPRGVPHRVLRPDAGPARLRRQRLRDGADPGRPAARPTA